MEKASELIRLLGVAAERRKNRIATTPGGEFNDAIVADIKLESRRFVLCEKDFTKEKTNERKSV